jgi:hypothetical protein
MTNTGDLELLLEMTPEERRRHFIESELSAAGARLNNLADEMKVVNGEINNQLEIAERYKDDAESLESCVELIISLKDYKSWLLKQIKETGVNIRWLRQQMNSKSLKKQDTETP